MIHLKSCPRCRGDVQECEDKDGRYDRCIQCGYHKDLNADRPLQRTRKNAQHEGPYLPEKPSNYVPWRDRERLAREKELT